eukprot:33932-Pyramimonas_sp.AAC.1
MPVIMTLARMCGCREGPRRRGCPLSPRTRARRRATPTMARGRCEPPCSRCNYCIVVITQQRAEQYHARLYIGMATSERRAPARRDTRHAIGSRSGHMLSALARCVV